ncbi:MAG TPA: FxLYD domain-containing protein [Verrucomicrobiae bacterium]|jgi:hypothetical protein
MSETKYFKCACAHCGGHIEFPVQAAGLSLACPHCGQPTDLTVPLASPPALSGTSLAGRKLVWLSLAGVVLIVCLLAGVAALQRFKDRLAPRRTAKAAPAASQNAQPAPPPKETNRPISTNEFSVASITIESTKGSRLIYAIGAVQNEANRPRFGVSLELDLFDENGRKIGTAKDYIQVVEPKKEWRFKAMVLGDTRPADAKLASIREREEP